jgi:hypothetical protein
MPMSVRGRAMYAHWETAGRRQLRAASSRALPPPGLWTREACAAISYLAGLLDVLQCILDTGSYGSERIEK